jgi:hypothetical protein
MARMSVGASGSGHQPQQSVGASGSGHQPQHIVGGSEATSSRSGELGRRAVS